MNALGYSNELISWLAGHVRVTDMFLVQSIVTCGALFWLLHRAWLTLWKPIPELISILGVEVPEPPHVSLAGIKADAVTLHWTRPAVNKPVVKYHIQVNGVNVGDSSRLETAITVTGLKPAHFYNVRVIAVGNNNFQAGSRVIRLRTYGRDGRPELGNARLSNNHSADDLQNGTVIDSSDESAVVRTHSVVIEAAALPEGASTMSREQGSGHLSARRNTGGRKHSPSTASDQPMLPQATIGNFSNESMQQLTERFETIRTETEESVAQVARDAEEFKQQMAELIKERDEKRQALREKEEASERLKKEAHHSERSNRQAQNRKTIKEKALREKQMERTKMEDDMARWQKETLDMQKEREAWEEDKDNLASTCSQKSHHLRSTNRNRQNSISAMEEEIRVKGLRLKELEEERQKLPGAEADEESKALDLAERHRDIQWDHKERDFITRANSQAIVFRNLEADLQKAQAFYAQLTVGRHIASPLMYNEGNSSGVDFDLAGQGRTKSRRSRQRKSRTNTISSPIAAYPIIDSSFPSASAYNNMSTSPSFAPGPYFDLSAPTGISQLSENSGMSEADIRALTAGAPLSPTATSLLPSNIFADEDPPSPIASSRAFGPVFASLGPSLYDNNSHSPESSSRSASLISSPQTSSQNLQAFPTVREPAMDSDRRSLSEVNFGVIGSPVMSNAEPPPVSSKRFGDLFTFPRQRGKTMQDGGPALGSLKTGQSQSFPRQTDEGEMASIRNRRTSFATGWTGLPFMNRGASDLIEGNGPAPARNFPSRRRGFKMFGSSIDDPMVIYSERDPSSPRPASIASFDLPRPSTDSAPFGWPAADSGVLNRTSPLAANWSMSLPHPWSRNTSRRTSIKHNSTTALSLGIASEEDEFLPSDQPSSATPVGVIGSRPMSSHNNTSTPRLNPAAPTFKAMFSRSKSDRPEKADKKLKGKAKDLSDPIDEANASDMSPSTSRASRDTHSIHTEASITESHDSLDRALSSTPSELTPAAISAKEKENSFQKLLRKGSSSKFSIASFRAKDSPLFGGVKKANSQSGDRSSNPGDLEEAGEDVLGKSVDSVTSSPQMGTGGTTTPREGRMGRNWGRFGMLKKGKDRRDSGEAERERSDMDTTEDETDA